MDQNKKQQILDRGPVPKHVAIIMDGNGRWAKERGLKRTEGHREGLNTIREISRVASKLGVEVLTVYAFSTENWSRPVDEVAYLMSLPKYLTEEFFPEIQENDIRVQTIGRTGKIPKATLKAIDQTIADTKDNKGMIINVAFNYGGRDEITHAVQSIASEVAEGSLKVKDIDQETISDHLYTATLGNLADPDLMIRTSGELRLSNFLLWQLAYSEFYFTDVYWPDFKEDQFIESIASYQERHRRYGGL